MVSAFQVGDKWIIARNPGEIPNPSINGTLSQSPGRITHGGCWTGEKWAAQTNFAKLFDSRNLALEYLQQNRQVVEASK